MKIQARFWSLISESDTTTHLLSNYSLLLLISTATYCGKQHALGQFDWLLAQFTMKPSQTNWQVWFCKGSGKFFSIDLQKPRMTPLFSVHYFLDNLRSIFLKWNLATARPSSVVPQKYRFKLVFLLRNKISHKKVTVYFTHYNSTKKLDNLHLTMFPWSFNGLPQDTPQDLQWTTPLVHVDGVLMSSPHVTYWNILWPCVIWALMVQD